MNVDVLNRSGIQAAASIAAGDRRLRHPSPPAGVGIGGVSKSLYPYLSKRWVDHVEEFGITYRQPWEKGSAYPEGPAAGVPPRCVPARWPLAGQRSGASWRSSISTRTTWRSAS